MSLEKLERWELLKVALGPRMWITALMGFSAGVPGFLVGSTLQAWMTTEGIDLGTIGLFSLVTIPSTLGFFWAPLMDRFVPPFLGRRRGWMIMGQVGLLIGILILSQLSPTESIKGIAIAALIITAFNGIQNKSIDAYRREHLPDRELGLGSSVYVLGFRLAMLATGAGALYLGARMPWNQVYLLMAALMFVGILTTLFSPEPKIEGKIPETILKAIIEPIKEFFSRKGALTFFFFFLLYKIGDQVAGNLRTPFYIQTGFSLDEIAFFGKTFGLIAAPAGTVIGGLIMIKFGILRSLIWFGILQMVSTFGFAFLDVVGPQNWALGSVIVFEELTSGMGTAAYLAFLMSICEKRFTAVQLAFLVAFMGLPADIFGAPMGFLVEKIGWFSFFMMCGFLALPGLYLARRMNPFYKK